MTQNKKSKSLFSRLLLTSLLKLQIVNLASSGVILGTFQLQHSSLQLIFIIFTPGRVLTLSAGQAAARVIGFLLGSRRQPCTGIFHWGLFAGRAPRACPKRPSPRGVKARREQMGLPYLILFSLWGWGPPPGCRGGL